MSRTGLLVACALLAGCLGGPDLEESEEALTPLGPAYAVRIESALTTQEVDAKGKVLRGPFTTTIATRGALFLRPAGDPALTSDLEGEFRACEVGLPNTGVNLQINEYAYGSLPTFPVKLRAAADGWFIDPWAILVGEHLVNPVNDSIELRQGDPRFRPLADGQPGLSVSFNVNDFLGNNHTVSLQVALRAILRGGWVRSNMVGGLEGYFSTVEHGVWVIKAEVTGWWDPSQNSANQQLRDQQAVWPLVGQSHTIEGIPIPPGATDVSVCQTVFGIYPR